MMIDRLGIKFIIGVNLTRASEIIYKATHSNQDKTQMNIQGSNLKYKIPYILIIAGTDANITLQSKDTTIL